MKRQRASPVGIAKNSGVTSKPGVGYPSGVSFDNASSIFVSSSELWLMKGTNRTNKNLRAVSLNLTRLFLVQ